MSAKSLPSRRNCKNCCRKLAERDGFCASCAVAFQAIKHAAKAARC